MKGVNMTKKDTVDAADMAALKELITVRFDELDKRMALRDTTNQQAIAVARELMEKRLAGMNEFRTQLKDQAANFVVKDTYETRHTALDNKLQDMQLWRANIDGRILMIVIGIPLFLALLEILIKIYWK
jgi:hypothetical protein